MVLWATGRPDMISLGLDETESQVTTSIVQIFYDVSCTNRFYDFVTHELEAMTLILSSSKFLLSVIVFL